MTPAVALRPATVRDADALTAVFLAARAGMDYLPRLHTDAETRWWMEHVVLARGTTFLAHDAHPRAFLTLHDAVVINLYVAPGFEGRGLGARLLARARAERPTGLSLYVFAQNRRARAFYEREGFRAARFGDGSDNEEGLPDVLYEWRPAA